MPKKARHGFLAYSGARCPWRTWLGGLYTGVLVLGLPYVAAGAVSSYVC